MNESDRPDAGEYRAHLDFRIGFVNGGDIRAEGFRIDLPSADVGEAEVGRLLVQHLGLALVSEVHLDRLEIVEEAHRGSRALGGDGAATQRRVVDLSHAIREGRITLPGIPAPVIRPHLTREASKASYEAGTDFVLDIIDLPGNTGTYLDAPFHRYDGGTDLAGLALDELVDLPAEVFHLADAVERGVPASVFYDRQLRGAAVLVHTGWDRHFGAPEYGVGAPFLTGDAAEYLVSQGVALVGIDSANIDDMVPQGPRPVHSTLLASGVHVVEHLTNLAELPPRGARFTAAPLRIEGFGTSPVRAFALLP